MLISVLTECDYDMYQCVDKTQCIPLAKYCDFRLDCEDGSDEYLCGKYIL